MTPRILCLGVAILDMIYAVERLPGQDGKYHSGSRAESGGGMAANAAVAIRRLGGHASYCGRLGDDEIGDRIRRDLAAEGVELRHVRTLPGVQSAHSIVLVDRAGNRAIVIYRSHEIEAATDWLPHDLTDDQDAVLADNRWLEGAVVVLKTARHQGKPGVLDAEGAGQGSSLAAIREASHVIFSASGLAEEFGTDDPVDGLRRAAEHAPFVAVTCGHEGVWWLDGTGKALHLPAFPVNAKETVGAGDIFHGAFTLALAEGRDEPDALRFASAVAALKCAGEGGRASFPRRPDVDSFLQKHGP